MTNKGKSVPQIDDMRSLTQQAAAWLIGTSPREVRDRGAPRNGDGTYDASEVVEWLMSRGQLANGDHAKLQSLKLQVDIEKKEEERDKLRRQRERETGESIPLADVRHLLGLVRTITQDAGRQAQRLWGDAGRQFYEDLWNNILSHWRQIMTDADGYVLCTRSAKTKRLKPVKKIESGRDS